MLIPGSVPHHNILARYRVIGSQDTDNACMPTQLRNHLLALASSQIRFTTYPARVRMHTCPLYPIRSHCQADQPQQCMHTGNWIDRYCPVSKASGQATTLLGRAFSYWEIGKTGRGCGLHADYGTVCWWELCLLSVPHYLLHLPSRRWTPGHIPHGAGE